MKSNNFEKFSKFSISEKTKVTGGTDWTSIAAAAEQVSGMTSGGGYFFGYGTSISDYSGSDGRCYYHFADGRTLRGDCP